MIPLARVTALRHVPFEDLGVIGDALRERGAAVEYVEAPLDDLAALDPLAADLLVALGGPIGAYEEASYPFLNAELALLGARLEAGRPVLGVCLGAQLMARALGARVHPGPAKEIGWSPLSLSEAGAASPLAAFGDHPVLHWHGDTFDLPAGARRLASTPLTANQAFDRGPNALGLQFHGEATAHGLEAWFVGHACEIAATPGVGVPALRADTARFAAETARRARRALDAWLDGLAAPA